MLVRKSPVQLRPHSADAVRREFLNLDATSFTQLHLDGGFVQHATSCSFMTIGVGDKELAELAPVFHAIRTIARRRADQPSLSTTLRPPRSPRIRQPRPILASAASSCAPQSGCGSHQSDDRERFRRFPDRVRRLTVRARNPGKRTSRCRRAKPLRSLCHSIDPAHAISLAYSGQSKL